MENDVHKALILFSKNYPNDRHFYRKMQPLRRNILIKYNQAFTPGYGLYAGIPPHARGDDKGEQKGGCIAILDSVINSHPSPLQHVLRNPHIGKAPIVEEILHGDFARIIRKHGDAVLRTLICRGIA